MTDMSIRPDFRQEGVYQPDNLLGGGFPAVTDTITIAEGQELPRGAVLGEITASGEYVLSAAGADDGSEKPVAILAESTDASSGAQRAPIYLTGEFNSRALEIGAGHTIESVKAALRPLSLFV